MLSLFCGAGQKYSQSAQVNAVRRCHPLQLSTWLSTHILYWSFSSVLSFGGIYFLIAEFALVHMINAGAFVRILFYVLAIFATNKVPAVNVINIAVPVVIDAITGDFFGVDPQDLFQVFMRGYRYLSR